MQWQDHLKCAAEIAAGAFGGDRCAMKLCQALDECQPQSQSAAAAPLRRQRSYLLADGRVQRLELVDVGRGVRLVQLRTGRVGNGDAPPAEGGDVGSEEESLCRWHGFAACPEDAIIKLGPKRGYEIDFDLCTGCAVCFEQCPCHAIEMIPEPAK